MEYYLGLHVDSLIKKLIDDLNKNFIIENDQVYLIWNDVSFTCNNIETKYLTLNSDEWPSDEAIYNMFGKGVLTKHGSGWAELVINHNNDD